MSTHYYGAAVVWRGRDGSSHHHENLIPQIEPLWGRTVVWTRWYGDSPKLAGHNKLPGRMSSHGDAPGTSSAEVEIPRGVSMEVGSAMNLDERIAFQVSRIVLEESSIRPGALYLRSAKDGGAWSKVYIFRKVVHHVQDDGSNWTCSLWAQTWDQWKTSWVKLLKV